MVDIHPAQICVPVLKVAEAKPPYGVSELSAGIYAALGALLCANKLNRTRAIYIFAIALVAALGPLIFLALLMFPFFFSELGLELALQLFVPVIPCVLPLVMIFKSKD